MESADGITKNALSPTVSCRNNMNRIYCISNTSPHFLHLLLPQDRRRNGRSRLQSAKSVKCVCRGNREKRFVPTRTAARIADVARHNAHAAIHATAATRMPRAECTLIHCQHRCPQCSRQGDVKQGTHEHRCLIGHVAPTHLSNTPPPLTHPPSPSTPTRITVPPTIHQVHYPHFLLHVHLFSFLFSSPFHYHAPVRHHGRRYRLV